MRTLSYICVFGILTTHLTLANEGGVISYVDSKNPGSVFDVNRMKGHPDTNPLRTIKITLQGNASYDIEVVHVARDKDWFPDAELTGLIEEVRFVCSFKSKEIPREARVVFPVSKEWELHHGARVEIPCSFNVKQTKNALTNARRLLIDSYSQDKRSSVISGSTILAEGCDIDPRQSQCVKWRNIIRQILDSTQKNALTDIGMYCDINFAVGLNETQQWVTDKMELSEVDPPDLNKQWNACDSAAFGMLFSHQEDWIWNQLPRNCHDEMIMGYKSYEDSHFNACWTALNRTLQKLEQKFKLKIDDFGETKVNNLDCIAAASSGDCNGLPPICVLGRVLSDYRNKFLSSKAHHKQEPNASSDLAKFRRNDVLKTLRNLTRYEYRAYNSSDGHTVGYLYGHDWDSSANCPYNKDCGTNVDCWALEMAIENYISNHAPKGVGCWSIEIASDDKFPPPLLFHDESDGCKKE